MPRLFVIPSRREPTAVILRRGPSHWYHVIQWRTRTDQFVYGAWFKGRIYEEKCDVSPDGRLLIYSVHQGSRCWTKFTSAWTAVSRVPWLEALVVWPQGTTYGGGGRFADNFSLTLRGVNPTPLADFPLRGLRLVPGNTDVQLSADEVPGADWSGRVFGGEVAFTRKGQLFRRIRGKDKLIADFTDLTPDPQPAPPWAGRPLPLRFRTSR